MIKILLSGSDGQLANDIKNVSELYTDEITLHTFNRKEWDVTDLEASKKIFELIQPDYYIHGASVHNANNIEENSMMALNVNVGATFHIAKLCEKYETKFINISTDYVFSESNEPTFRQSTEQNGWEYSLIEKTITNPCNMYGFTKKMSEEVLKLCQIDYINIRVSGLFGKTGSRAKNGMNFPYLIIQKLIKGEKIDVVDDQQISISYSREVAEFIFKLIKNNIGEEFEGKDYFDRYASFDFDKVHNNALHLVNEGKLTWYELACYIADSLGYDSKTYINPVKTDDFYNANFKRPKMSFLKNSKTKQKLSHWKVAVMNFLVETEYLQVNKEKLK